MESSAQISNESLGNCAIGNRISLPLRPMGETARITSTTLLRTLKVMDIY